MWMLIIELVRKEVVRRCLSNLMARYHFFVAVISIFPLGLFWNPPSIIPFMLGAVLIDCDHQIDFYLLKKRFTLSVTELSETLSEDNEFAPGAKFVLPLHSYEAILSPLLLAPYLPIPISWTNAFASGVVIHMIFDILTNGYSSPISLSLTYRLMKRWYRNDS